MNIDELTIKEFLLKEIITFDIMTNYLYSDVYINTFILKGKLGYIVLPNESYSGRPYYLNLPLSLELNRNVYFSSHANDSWSK